MYNLLHMCSCVSNINYYYYYYYLKLITLHSKIKFSPKSSQVIATIKNRKRNDSNHTCEKDNRYN